MSLQAILSLIERHERWRVNECINLVASENITSAAVRKVLGSDLGHRYGGEYYTGTKFLNKIVDTATNLARQLFKANYANLRPLSGHIADLIVLSCFKKNEKILILPRQIGGYRLEGIANVLGLQVLYLPFNPDEREVDVEQAKAIIFKEEPACVFLAMSAPLFPYPVAELSEACHQVGSTFVYDASHVLGLVAGGKFQDPLREGADILCGSTHKSFFGPQGALIVTGEKYGEMIEPMTHDIKGVIASPHYNRIAALGIALAETHAFGREYAEQVVKNAKALAKGLDERGILPTYSERGRARGYTEAHICLITRIGERAITREDGLKIGKQLEKANLIGGSRLGVSEVTRWGMKENEMDRIAEFVSRVIVNKEDPEQVRLDVIRLKRGFATLKYCFEDI